MKDNTQIRFWLEKAVEDISAARPEGELIISSGASPSGMYHIGHLREFLTADAIAWGLRQSGRDARHLHFVDDMDRFRKVPSNIDASFEQHLGKPLYKVPSPDGSNKSYADYWFDQINEAMTAMGAEMEVVYSHDRYKSGFFTESLETALKDMDLIRDVIETVSGRQLPRSWAPVQLLDENDSYDTREFTGINIDDKIVAYTTKSGETGKMSYTDGRVKLDWRIDWPARWALLPVAVEPFGRDHATKGGSYDTGKEIVERLYKSPAPIPYPYEFINIKGETKKMSASSGNGILPLDALKMMPPALLKNFVLGSRPSLQLFIDLGSGFGRMFDVFADSEKLAEGSEVSLSMRLAKNNSPERILPDVPFNHMVVAWQSARKDADKAIEVLKRSEYSDSVAQQVELIKSMFPYIDYWLDTRAPDVLKFTVQDKLPEVKLSDSQKEMLEMIAAQIMGYDGHKTGDWYHSQIHEARESCDLTPKEAFQALYRVILAKDSGPKAGWFLSTFDPKWIVTRFREK